jgi:N-acetylglutamate synthase-like GNAT family acetyltransferase
MALTDEQLREAASHRGLKLVKSRKRKAGVGDYGKLGLTDPTGKPLFGVGDNGLTASAEEIADYLRAGEVSTWAESARVTPQAEPRTRTTSAEGSDPEPPPAVIRPRPRRSVGSAPASRRVEDAVGEVGKEDARGASDRASRSASLSGRIEDEVPAPPPVLAVRSARGADADALKALLSTVGYDGGVSTIRKAIASAAARTEPILVADRGGVIGLLAWTIIPDIVEGAIGRISIIVVNEQDRRDGVSKALYEAALEKLGIRKVRLIEGMSDIEIRNANGFLRALGLQQASYRFVTRI